MSDRGVSRLAAAVLLQAIQDVTSSSTGRRAGAMRWIFGNEQNGYSFEFVCRTLNRDPEVIRPPARPFGDLRGFPPAYGGSVLNAPSWLRQ
jgi:hypothetical protein